MKIFNNKLAAFSLLEMMLVVIMIGVLASIFAPSFSQLFYRNNLDTATEKVKTDLYRAQSLARAASNDSNWGVYLTSSTSLIFLGNSYATRNISFDESADLPGDIVFQGANEIVFIKQSGYPISESIITIRQGNDQKTITINQKGLIF